MAHPVAWVASTGGLTVSRRRDIPPGTRPTGRHCGCASKPVLTSTPTGADSAAGGTWATAVTAP